MKRITTQILLLLLVATAARADTALTISPAPIDACLFNNVALLSPPAISGSFALNGVAGSGQFQSSVLSYAPYPPYNAEYVFNYSIDLSGLSPAANHCVKLLIHFGTPSGCSAQVQGSPGQIQSATLSAYGDVTFVFNGGCLQPGQASVNFKMLSDAGIKTNIVTVIDDYIDLASGQTNETRRFIPALVPDVPPNLPPWAYAPPPIQNIFFQGFFGTNYYNPTNNRPFVSGTFDFKSQLYNAPSNGLAISQVFTQTVQVVNGLFNLPLLFDPISVGDRSSHWLNIGVRPTGSNVDFTPLNPPLPLTPAPQAFYAYTAGVVADLMPGQAVLSLNGLTDAVNLQAGSGIIIGTNGNNLTITAAAGSDRNIKTDINAIKPDDILNRLTLLPISSWRYNNEPNGIRHVGPMAQDFKAVFDLGDSDKFIGFVDEGGIALAAIQGLHQKLQDQSAQLKARDAEIQDLKDQTAQLSARNAEIQQLKQQNALLEQRLEKVERRVNAEIGGAQ
jgi:hypothetical protein